MKQIRSALAMLLAVAMTMGLVSPAFATPMPPDEQAKAEVKISQAAETNSNALAAYPTAQKLVVSATVSNPDEAVSVIWVALSYDNTVVEPIGYARRTGYYIPDSITTGNITEIGPFTALKEDDYGFNSSGIKWAVQGNRTAFVYTIASTDNVEGTFFDAEMPVMEFRFRVKDNATAKADTFRIETADLSDSLLPLLFTKEAEQNSITFFAKSGESNDMYYGSKTHVDNMTATLEFEHEEGTLASFAMAPADARVTIPATGEATCNITATAKDGADGTGADLPFPADAAWSLENAPEGVTLNPDTGATVTLHVPSTTVVGATGMATVNVKVTSGGVTGTLPVTIATPAPALTSVVFKQGENLVTSVEADGTEKTVNAVAQDGSGNPFDGVNWSIQPTDEKVTIDAASGLITVKADAEAKEYTVTAAASGQEPKSAVLTVTRAASAAKTVKLVDGADEKTEVSVQVDGTTGGEYPVKVYDQFDAVMTDAGLSVVKVTGEGGDETEAPATAADGVSVADGKVVVSAKAQAGTYKVKSGAAAAVVNVTRAAAAPTELHIHKDGATAPLTVDDENNAADSVTKPTGSDPETHVYTVDIVDQYGDHIDGNTTLALKAGTTEPAGVTFTPGTGDHAGEYTVSVSKDAAKDSKLYLTASTIAGVNLPDVELTITVVDITFEGVTGIQTAEHPTYGMTWAQIVTWPENSLKAKVSGTEVEGTFTVRGVTAETARASDSTVYPGAGEKQYEVVFNSTTDGEPNGTYENVRVGNVGTVTIAPKAIEVTARSASRPYGEADPAFELEDPAAGVLVEGDTKAELGMTLTSTATTATNAGTPDIKITGTASNPNYNVNVKEGTLTITKAALKTLNFQDGATGTVTIPASDPANTSIDALKAKLPQKANATYGSSDTAVEDLDLAWTAVSTTYDKKGGTYTFTGTPVLAEDGNFTADGKTLGGTVTVTKITATVAELPDEYMVSVGTVNAAGSSLSYQTFKLPAKVNVTYDPAVTGAETNPTATWDKDVSALKNAAVVNGSVTANLTCLPDWATVAADELKATIKFTDKTPVVLNITTPASVQYGSQPDNPTVTVSAASGEPTPVEPDGGWQFTYSWVGVDGTSYAPSASKPTAVGSYKVTAALNSNVYRGEATSGVVQITARVLQNSDMTLSLPAEGYYTYDGTAKTPAATVTCGGRTLTAGVDYDLSYANNVDAGRGYATATATGKGNYTGTATQEFLIQAKDLRGLTPVISGEAKVGGVLTASVQGIPSEDIGWQWRFVPDDGISGVTGTSIVVDERMSGRTIQVQGVATNSLSTNYVGQTNMSGTVEIAKLGVTGAIVIHVSSDAGDIGKIDAGDTLSVDLDGVQPSLTSLGLVEGTDYEVVWSPAVSGSTAGSYMVPSGASTVTATLNMKGRFTGNLSDSVKVGSRMITGSLTVDGTPAAGERLTAKLDGNDVSTSDYNVTWWVDGRQAGTGNPYTVRSEDQGKAVTAKVTSKAGDVTGTLTCLVRVPANAPGKPVIQTSAGNGQVTVSWTAPASNGAPITSYTLICREKDGSGYTTIELSAGTTSRTVTGLTNGKTYTFTVAATNVVGSTPSDPKDATPSSGYHPGPNPDDPGPTIPVTPVNPTPSPAPSESQPVDPNQPAKPDNDIVVEVPATKVDDGYVATVEGSKADKVISEAKETSGSLIVVPEVGQGAEKVSVTIPAKVIGGVAQAPASDLTVRTPVADVVMGTQTLTGLSGAQNVTVTTEHADDKVNITVAADGETLSTVTGGVVVRLPQNEGVSAGTVAMLVGPDGSESVIRGSIVLGTTLVVPLDGSATVRVVDNTKYFTDMSGHWGQGSVDFVSSRELFQGTGTGETFSPDMNMSRGMLVTVLYRLDGEKDTGAASNFTDVDWNDWFADAVDWAVSAGVANGVGNGAFAPNANISRQEIAAMLYRYAEKLGLDVSKRGDLSGYADGYSVADWATEAMRWAVGAGILTGKPGELLDPSGLANRTEVATMLERFVKFSVQ